MYRCCAILFLTLNLITSQAQNKWKMQDFAGEWRGEFELKQGLLVPFNFEISGSGKVFLLNADERFESGEISIEKDSLFIPLDQFDNELAFQISRNHLKGEWRNQDHIGPHAS